MRTSNQYRFSELPEVDIPRSSFNRSHTYKTTFDSGYLVPFYLDEVLPGDTFKCKVNLFARMATPVVPVMDNMYLETFFFYCPSRILWENWAKFLGEKKNPNDSIDYLIPTLAESSSGVDVGSLYDYMGIPPSIPLTEHNPINALPFRMYNKVWNEFFRAEFLQDSIKENEGDGPDALSDYELKKRNKRFDYFTSANPFVQAGEPVTIGLTGSAPVIPDGQYIRATTTTTSDTSWPAGTLTVPKQYTSSENYGNDVQVRLSGNQSTVFAVNGLNLVADLGNTNAIQINELRTAFQIQKFLEKTARSGYRIKELILGHFGVTVPDSRLQRPEYLGGSSTRIIVKPVEQTSASDGTSPQGNLAAFAVGADSFHGFTKSFVEHGYIIGLVNVRADLTYQQGLDRLFTRRDRFDYYWPSFAHLGEQAVLNQEIYMQGTSADMDVFGYQERYAEYRYKPSMITGKFRSTDPQSLDVWHLAQKFDELPKLNSEFISEDPPVDRVIAVPSEPQFIFDSEINLTCVRPMPVYSVPGLVDHF